MDGFVLAMVVILFVAAALFFKIYFLGKKYENRKGYIIIPCTAETENLERIVKGYYWEEIFENENYGRLILLVQMEKSENMYISKRLEQEYSIVKCIDLSELSEFLKRKELKCYGRK